jgi:hypothetical protein
VSATVRVNPNSDWFSQLDDHVTQEVAKPVPNQEEILRSIRLLFDDGQVIELRAPATKKQTQSGYYDDFQKFAKDAAGLSSQESVPAVYWTLQNVNPALLSRSANHIKAHAKFSTTDAEIIEYQFLPLDCDPVRPAHVSSSNEEKAASFVVAKQLRDYLSKRNIPTILADSGNGYHVLARIQLPVNKETRELVQGILVGMAEKFDTDAVKIDRKNFNPSRILKAYGTVARKGDHTADRPWRVTNILDCPPLRTVGEVEMRCLLAELPGPVQNTDKISDSQIENKAIKMESFMAEAEIGHRDRLDYKGGFKWQLEACPFNPDHAVPDSFTFVLADAIGFSCSHNSCVENKWKQFRALLEKRIGRRFSFTDTQNLKAEFTGHLAQPPAPPPVPSAEIPQPRSEFVPTSCTADTIQPKQIRWLWTHRFAEKINLLVGNPDNGKGLVSIYTVARLTTGEPWFDAENKLPPSEALILAAEDDWDDIIVPRLMAAGADLKNVHKLVMSAQINGSKVEKELSLDRDRSVLDNYLQKHPAIRLVVIDPVSNYLGRTKMIDEQSVRELLAPFKEMASRLHVAFLCIMHLNKKVELDAIHRIGGAMAFTGIARMVWLCAPKPNEDDLHALIHFGCSVRLWLVHEVSSQTQHADRSHRLFMHIPCRHTGTVVNDLCFKSGQ